MSQTYRVALLGFSASVRAQLVAAFAAPRSHGPAYAIEPSLLPMLDDADVVIADADHPASVQLVVVTERVGDTVFIGGSPPPFGAAAWMPGPVDPLHLLRELDALMMPLLAEGRVEPPVAQGLDLDLDAGGGVPFPLLPPLLPSLPPESPEPARAALPARTPAALRAWTPPDDARPRRALVVDDSETARQFLRSRLQAWGLQVDTASSSGQALALLFRQHYDHLFLDVDLGAGSRLDGLALCQLVRRKKMALGGAPELVVIVSAHDGQIDRARGTLAGCDAYLGKPLDDADLNQLLRNQGLKPPADSPASPRA